MKAVELAPILRIKARPTQADLRDAAELAATLPVLLTGTRRDRDPDAVRCRLEQALWATAIRADVPIGVDDTAGDVAVKLHTWNVLATEVAQAVWAVVEAGQWDGSADRLAAHLMLRARYG